MGEDICKPLKLELFASIWYLLPSQMISEEDQDAVLEIMCREKPHFESSEVESTLQTIIDFKKKYTL